MIKGLLFDLDGVLLDTEMWHIRLDEKCLKDLGYDDVDPMVFVHLIGAGKGMDPWEAIYRQLPEEYRKKGFKEEFRSYKMSQFDFPPFKELIFPEVRNTLKRLKEEGYLMACCSSSRPEYIHKALKDCEISEYFDVVLSGHDFVASKPDPEIYLTAMSRLGLNADECMVVEDSPYGIKAGKNAGMAVSCIKDHHFNMDQSEADYMFDDLEGLYSLLQGAQEKDPSQIMGQCVVPHFE